MRHLPRFRANTRLALLSATASLTTVATCGNQDPCLDKLDAIATCERFLADDACAAPVDRCRVACWATLSCEAWDAWADGRLPPRTQRCLSKCIETFQCDDGNAILAGWQCDASEDCADGSDERDCDYFRCDSGAAIRADYACDGVSDCDDASDEEGCAPWCDGGAVSEGDVCDGGADCGDASAEEGCQ